MNFDEASAAVLPTGRHAGKTIGDVGNTLAGIEYLSWYRQRGAIPGPTYLALSRYLSEPAIRADLDELYGRKGN